MLAYVADGSVSPLHFPIAIFASVAFWYEASKSSIPQYFQKVLKMVSDRFLRVPWSGEAPLELGPLPKSVPTDKLLLRHSELEESRTGFLPGRAWRFKRDYGVNFSLHFAAGGFGLYVRCSRSLGRIVGISPSGLSTGVGLSGS
jgi:hypothetical protein